MTSAGVIGDQPCHDISTANSLKEGAVASLRLCVEKSLLPHPAAPCTRGPESFDGLAAKHILCGEMIVVFFLSFSVLFDSREVCPTIRLVSGKPRPF